MADAQLSSGDTSLLLRVVGRVDREQVAERWLSLVRKLPAEERLPDTLNSASARDLMGAHLDAFTRLLVENRDLNQHEMEDIRRAALEWVGRGVSVEAIVHAVLLGASVALRLVAENASPEENGAIVFATERMMGVLEHYTVALAPLRLHNRAQVIHDEERRSRSLAEGLTAGAEITRETSALAAELGFEIVDEYRPLVAAAPGKPPQAQFELATQLRSGGVLAFSDGVRALGMAPAWPERDLPDHRGCVSVVGDVTRRSELTAALADLSLLVDLGCRFGHPGRLAVDEFPLERLLLRSPELAKMIERRVLEPLKASPDLIETVEMMIRNGMKRASAAEALHVHPSTVDYRMRRAQELTGLDLSSPKDLALAVLAMEHRSLAH